MTEQQYDDVDDIVRQWQEQHLDCQRDDETQIDLAGETFWLE